MEAKDKMNRLKVFPWRKLHKNKKKEQILNPLFQEREWYRPVAPVLPLSYKDVYFEVSCIVPLRNSFLFIFSSPSQPTPPSPYMSFAPKVKEFVKEILPAIVHYDSTSRLQTVTERFEKF